MHNLIRNGVTKRRVTAVSALVIAGGLAGTTLLMQGTARADSAIATSTSITGTTQLLIDPGIPPVLKVDVAVSAQSGSQSPDGSVLVGTQTPDGTIYKCTATLSSSGSGSAAGSCELRLPYGSYDLNAGYLGSSTFARSNASTTKAAVGKAPSFTADSPSLTAQARGYYSYTFAAKGVPQPTFKLVDAPVWMNIDPTTGHAYGWLPSTVRSFSYTVVASNAVGSAKETFTVTTGGQQVDTWLSCPRSVSVGHSGSCTLHVRNNGPFVAHNVIADITLPRALQARGCWLGWGWSWGHGPSCKVDGSTVSWHAGRLWAGQTKAFVVYFTAKRSFWNASSVTVTVKGDATWDSRVDMGGGPVQISTCSAKVTVYQRGWWG